MHLFGKARSLEHMRGNNHVCRSSVVSLSLFNLTNDKSPSAWAVGWYGTRLVVDGRYWSVRFLAFVQRVVSIGFRQPFRPPSAPFGCTGGGPPRPLPMPIYTTPYGVDLLYSAIESSFPTDKLSCHSHHVNGCLQSYSGSPVNRPPHSTAQYKNLKLPQIKL